MEFVIDEGDNSCHDQTWRIYSSLHMHPVCLGCMIETLERSDLLPLQKQPALSELLRLLCQQYENILQLFLQEERIVWHILALMLDSLMLADDSYQATAIDTVLKLVERVGCEDLVNSILDNITEKVKSCYSVDRTNLLPYYTLLGKMLHQFPGLATTLLCNYEDLLNELSLELGAGGEGLQSAVAYMFIFLCGEKRGLSPRIHHQLHTGIITMLTSAQALPVQINGLGLLKKLIQEVDGVAGLMSVQAGDQSLLACIKRLLLSKQEVLQVGACHVLAQLLDPVAGETYGPQVLQSDFVEFLFEALNTEQTLQMESIFKVLKTLSGLGQFYKRCHAVYGVESLLRAVTVAKEMKNPHLLELGFSVLAQVLTKHPSDMPLFVSPGVVQKCLGVVRGGLEHQQAAVFYQAMDTLTPLLSKKYLLTPIPFDNLGDLVTKATMHVWADLVQRSGTRRGQGDRHLRVEQTHKYMEMLSSCVKLCLECAGDHTLCESSFAVPDMDDQSESSSEKFAHTVLAAVDDMGIPLMMVILSSMGGYPLMMLYWERGDSHEWYIQGLNLLADLYDLDTMATSELLYSVNLSWERGDNPEWYIQCLNLLADLHDLDTMATSELLYKLLTAGFLTSLLELKQRFNSGILTRSIGKVLSLLLICCKSKGLLPPNMDLTGRFTLEGLDWKVADLPEVFGGSVLPKSVVESYLLLLYTDLQLENRILSAEQLAALVQATVDHQCAVDQLSPLAQKHFIYLLAYVCVAGSCNINCIISNGVGSVARLMEGRMEDWYTHNPMLLHWGFLDPILAGTCGHSVLLAFLTHANKEEVVDLLCVGYHRNADENAFLQLAQGQAFMMALLRILRTGSIDVVSKAMLMCETLIGLRSENTEVNLGADCPNNVQQKDTRWEDFDVLFEKVSESVAKIFLKSCPESEDHNLTSLLLVLLMLCKVRPQSSVDVKVIYHVLNTLGSKPEGPSTEVKRVCLLVILATLSTLPGTREQTTHLPVCTMVCQHDGFLGHLQACLDRRYGDEIFSIATDILAGILSYPDVKCSVPLVLELNRLYTIVTKCSGARQTASVGLLGAVYRTGLSHGAISLTGRLDDGQYRALHIHLQQLCLQATEVSSAAVSCMVALLKYLLDECPELGCELVCQPWNLTLLDVILDISDTPITDHQMQLITMLMENEETCTQLQHYDGLVEKLVTAMNQRQNHALHGTSRLANHLVEKFQSKLTEEECVVLRNLGSCASAFSAKVPREV